MYVALFDCKARDLIHLPTKSFFCNFSYIVTAALCIKRNYQKLVSAIKLYSMSITFISFNALDKFILSYRFELIFSLHLYILYREADN